MNGMPADSLNEPLHLNTRGAAFPFFSSVWAADDAFFLVLGMLEGYKQSIANGYAGFAV